MLMIVVMVVVSSSVATCTPNIGSTLASNMTNAVAARVAVHGANSAQIDPPEAGINHFNSGTDSSAWTFAAQAKAGVRFALGDSAFVFGEYRYLYIGANDQIFGPTTYFVHAPTSAWTVRFGDMSNHLGAAGIGFRF
jgi:opacity protein-like surface antigen